MSKNRLIKILSNPVTATAGLLLMGLTIYAAAFPASFVFDDYGNIVDNPQILMNGPTCQTMADLTRPPSPHRPLAKLTFALNHAWHGLDADGFRLINLIIHVINGWLVFGLARLIPRSGDRKNGWGPYLAALIWLTIPLHTQSVTYIVQRMNSLATLFYLVSLICYIQARRRHILGLGRIGVVLLFTGSCFSGLFGLFTKETAITLPLFIFFYEWFFFQDLDRIWLKNHLGRLGLVIIVCAFVAAIYLDGNPTRKISESYLDKPFTWSQRLLTQPRVVLYYLSLLAWPHPGRLTLDYDFPLSKTPMDPAVTLLALAGLAALVLLTFWSARKHRLLSFAVLWFLGNLVVESSVMGLALVFEHRTYLPSIWPVMAAVLCLTDRTRRPGLAIILLTALALGGAFGTYQRNLVWRDKITLWQDCLAKAPENPRASHNLALALDRGGRYPEAIVYYRRSLATIARQDASDQAAISNVHANLGAVLLKTEQYAEARRHLKQAVDSLRHSSTPDVPRIAGICKQLGLTELRLGNPDEARGYFKQALALKIRTAGATHPDTAEAYNNLGVAYEIAGRTDAAAACYRRALAIFRAALGEGHPDTLTARENLAGLGPTDPME